MVLSTIIDTDILADWLMANPEGIVCDLLGILWKHKVLIEGIRYL